MTSSHLEVRVQALVVLHPRLHALERQPRAVCLRVVRMSKAAREGAEPQEVAMRHDREGRGCVAQLLVSAIYWYVYLAVGLDLLV